MEAKQIPYDIEAEQAVLGAMFLSPNLIPLASKRLRADEFYIQAHQVLFETLKLCQVKGAVDLVCLKAELERGHALETVGGMEKIVELANLVPAVDQGSVKRYCAIVRDCAERRRMIAVYSQAMQGMYDRGRRIGGVNDTVQAELTKADRQQGGLIPFANAFYSFVGDLERRQKAGEKMPGLSTGYDDLDVYLGGLERKRLYVLAARPAMGKTALALNIAANLAEKGNKAAFFSLEMGGNELVRRVVAHIAHINSYKMKMANVTDRDYEEMTEVLEKLKHDNLYIDETPGRTMEGILSECLRLNARLKQTGQRLNAVFIDHLQILRNANRKLDRRLAIGESSHLAKEMSKILDCPVILLSQLNRANEQRQSKVPVLSDLRESGDVEQDADVVIMLHREEYYKETEENRGCTDVIITKNRDGEVGNLKLGWNRKYTSFVPWEEYTAAGPAPKEKNSSSTRKKRDAETEKYVQEKING